MAINKPTIASLLSHTGNRYTLAVMSSKRARQIIAGSQPTIVTRETKPLTIAVHEIDTGSIVSDTELPATPTEE